MKKMMYLGCTAFILLCSFGVVEPQSTPEIQLLHIRSDISFRFATTQVTSCLMNNDQASTEATFKVTLPQTAFMSNFSMDIGNQTIFGVVKDKDAAKQQYEDAKERGQSAGHVAASTRNSNDFDVSVNVASGEKVTFNLWYQEVLQRRLGHYEHIINIDPGQVVPDLKVEVYINESRPLTVVHVPPIRKEGAKDTEKEKKKNSDVIISQPTENSAIILYIPSDSKQKQESSKGILGQFVVQYDVERALDGGEIQVVNGYFVHAAAPVGLPPVPKNVLFILDKSGSMRGRKMDQLKDAMHTILDDLRHDDQFNILSFSTETHFWMPRFHKVNVETLRGAKRMVASLGADGMTAIDDAFKRGIQFLDAHVEPNEEKPTIIIFLTDGDPTIGETNTDQISSNIRNANRGRYIIFSLGFGQNLNFNFLKAMSLQNGGLARKIYEASDAALQLEDFYKEVSIPLLYNVSITYETTGSNVTDVTRHKFRTYFSGQEMVVAGRSRDVRHPDDIRMCIWGYTVEGDIRICPPGPWPPVGPPRPRPTFAPEEGLAAFVERMWAYLTIKELLDDALISTNPVEIAELRDKALKLSLQFHFVTELTSMVVTLPSENNTNIGTFEETDSPDSDDAFGMPPGRQAFPVAPRSSRGQRGQQGQRGQRGPQGQSGQPGSPGQPGLSPLRRRQPTTQRNRQIVTSRPTVRPTTAAPVLGQPSMIIHKSSVALCLSWPQMPLSAHILMKDDDIIIRGIHGERGLLQSADVIITQPKLKALIAPAFLLIDHKLRDWGKSYTNGQITVDNGTVSVTLRSGTVVKFIQRDAYGICMEVADEKGIPGGYNSLLRKVSRWRLTKNDTLIVPHYFHLEYETHNATVCGTPCKAVQNNIFELAGHPRRAK